MAAAPGGVVDQAQRLVSCARLLPADEAAKALEQVANIVSAAQADILIGAEHRGELNGSGCATVRTFAATILRRSVHDASGVARVAQHLVELPKLAAAYRTGTWGWTGPSPAPPPGHAPPRRTDATAAVGTPS
jgi:hypothetical protein